MTPQPDNSEVNKTVRSLIHSLGFSTRVLVVLLVGIIIVLVYQLQSQKEGTSVAYNTALIQEQIKNVGKLVVTEGHFAEVLTYKDSKKTYIPGLTFDKKALVIINADVTVGFDLSKVKYDIDATSKTVTITNIPKEEIKISPDIQYYDTESSTFNEFTGDDYNKINKIVRENLKKKIEKSTLKSNAKNRLISELSKILILTNSMKWTLKYNGEVVKSNQEFQSKISD